MSGPALFVAPFVALEVVVGVWALATGRLAAVWKWLKTWLLPPHRRAVASPATPRLELKAPNPRPGQCPVCSLLDLDERAVGDALLGDSGTALARVVPYGADRAHAECAAVVPYVAPLRSTSGGTDLVHVGGVFNMMAGKPNLCPCPACERTRGRPRPLLVPDLKGRQSAGLVSQLSPLPEASTRPAFEAGDLAKVTLGVSGGGDRLEVSQPVPAGTYRLRRSDGHEFLVRVERSYFSVTTCTLILAEPLAYWVNEGDVLARLYAPDAGPAGRVRQ